MKQSFHLLYLLILLFTFTSFSEATEDHSQDICFKHGAGVIYPAAIDITTSGYTFNSNACMADYSIDLTNPLYANKYVIIELTLTSFPTGNDANGYTPNLIGKKNARPGRDYSTSSNGPDAVDLSGIYSKKTYHYIILDPSISNGVGTYYAAFYKIMLKDLQNQNYYEGSLTYTIKATGSFTYPCPRSCSGQGTCDTNLKKCICNPGFIDYDCSIQATLINIPGNFSTLPVLGSSAAYLYLPIQDFGNSVTITITNSNKYAIIYYYYGVITDTTIPQLAMTNAHLPDVMNAPDFISVFQISENDQKTTYSNQVLFLAASNGEASPITFNIDASVPPSKLSTGAIVGIVIGSIFGLIIIVIVIRMIYIRQRRKASSDRIQDRNRNRSRNRNLRPAPNQSNSRTTSARRDSHRALVNNNINHNPNNRNNNEVALVIPISQFLTIAQINKYFPQTNYSKIDNHFQPNCSICLDDFKPKISCRKLYCGHVFHGKCIEFWFKQHDKCPNCNALMTVVAINEHKNNPQLITPKLITVSRPQSPESNSNSSELRLVSAHEV